MNGVGAKLCAASLPTLLVKCPEGGPARATGFAEHALSVARAMLRVSVKVMLGGLPPAVAAADVIAHVQRAAADEGLQPRVAVLEQGKTKCV